MPPARPAGMDQVARTRRAAQAVPKLSPGADESW